MTSQLASLKSKPSPITEVTGSHSTDTYGIHDVLRYGVTSAKSSITSSHPLEVPERNYEVSRERMTHEALRHSQGLHAPLKLKMEKMLVSKTQRMPPLISSNMSLDTLTGHNESVDFSDYLNIAEDSEVDISGRVAMEKRLKMF